MGYIDPSTRQPGDTVPRDPRHEGHRVPLRLASEHPPEKVADAQRAMAAGGIRRHAVTVV